MMIKDSKHRWHIGIHLSFNLWLVLDNFDSELFYSRQIGMGPIWIEFAFLRPHYWQGASHD